jgi:transcriptional regulator with XRE-family HTH domain
MHSSDIVKAMRADKVSQAELAARAGLSRETISRWESGVNQPSLESLARLAMVAGTHLEVRLNPAEPELIALAEGQLERAPAQRLKALLGDAWPACRDALRAAVVVGDLGVLVGPVGASLLGAPQRPFKGRVDLLVARQHLGRVGDRLFDAGYWPEGVEEVPGSGESRERWRVGRGRVTLRTAAAGVVDIDGLRGRAHAVALNGRSGQRTVYVASIEDLLAIAERSPWGEDAVYRTGLRAVLASPRYWRDQPADHGVAVA